MNTLSPAFALLVIFLAPLFAFAAPATEFSRPKIHELWYDRPAPELPTVSKAERNLPKIVAETPSDPAWENWSLPVGNGYLGATVFGRTVTERVQLTENSLASGSLYNGVGLTGFAELYLDFGHTAPLAYRRALSLDDAVATVSYEQDGVRHEREYFASYPDKVLVIRLGASRPGRVSFTARPENPYPRPFGSASGGAGRDGLVTASADGLLTLAGRVEALGLLYEGQFKIIPSGGKMEVGKNADGAPDRLVVTGADSAIILVALGTNYRLAESVFTENDRKKKLAGNPHPHERVSAILAAAAAKSFDELRAAHLADYHRLFERAAVDFGGRPSTLTTDRLLAAYKAGAADPYLEELYFNYGRYLLICSSRPGTLPPNLQGIWSQYEVSPWTGGYWHNINIQMNYWPVFNTNLAELFPSFVAYNAAYRSTAAEVATGYIRKNNPAALDPAGDNGWTIGTGASAYNISAPGGHSGPGTGGMTTKLFWDYYAFTGDTTALREVAYPAILGMARFLSKVTVEKDGLLLTSPSYSPEQRSRATKLHYPTVGAAFDQQMIFENHRDALKAAKILGDTAPFLDVIRAQLPRLDPVQVGWSGQIKEYREEKYYGDLVDPKHRHISQLVGLYPGTIINSTTPAWLDAARESLERRGDKSTGWAMAHRLNCWARLKDGERAYQLYQGLLANSTLANLWCSHPPFQIDGNFGGTAGVAEMLLQSHEGHMELLPALPPAWPDGSFRGLVARGNFEVSARWAGGRAVAVELHAVRGGPCLLRYPGIERAELTDVAGRVAPFTSPRPDFIAFETSPGATYRLARFPEVLSVRPPAALAAQPGDGERVTLTWEKSPDAESYRIYRHLASEPDYRLVASNVRATTQVVAAPELAADGHALFRVTAVDVAGRESSGARVTLAPENP